MKAKTQYKEVFLTAAERLLLCKESFITGLKFSSYCCDHINEVSEELYSCPWGTGECIKLFESYFMPRGEWNMGWWPELPDSSCDYESRILALLLMVEITKDLE